MSQKYRIAAVALIALGMLGAPVARADDAARLANLDRLLAAGQADAVVAAASGILAAGDFEPRNRWRFQQRLGVALVTADRPAEAVQPLELAIVDAPQEPALHLNLGRALRAMGHGGRAVSEYGLAVNLAPQRHDWRLEYAVALQSLGIRRDALTQIRRARDLCGDCPEALRGEINYQRAFGEPADTVDPLRALLTVEPSQPTHRLLVRTLWNLGDTAAAAALLDTVPDARLDGDDLSLLLEMDRRLGRTQRSLAWIADDGAVAERVNRPPDQVWAVVSEICLTGQETEAALAAIDRAVALAPDNAVYHHNRAAVLVALGRQDEARRALDEAQRLDPRLGSSP